MTKLSKRRTNRRRLVEKDISIGRNKNKPIGPHNIPDLTDYVQITVSKNNLKPGMRVFWEMKPDAGCHIPQSGWWIHYEVTSVEWYINKANAFHGDLNVCKVKGNILGGTRGYYNYKNPNPKGGFLIREGKMLTVRLDPRIVEEDPFAFYDKIKENRKKAINTTNEPDPFYFIKERDAWAEEEAKSEGTFGPHPNAIISNGGFFIDTSDPAKNKAYEKQKKKAERDRELYAFGAGKRRREEFEAEEAAKKSPTKPVIKKKSPQPDSLPKPKKFKPKKTHSDLTISNSNGKIPPNTNIKLRGGKIVPDRLRSDR